MKITSIKQQVRNLERVSIFVDGKYSFSLSLSELVEQKLKNNAELDEGEVKRLKKLSTDGKLKARALEWLLNRPHSTREFKDYMYRKKAEPQLIENLIKEFSKRGYLDDAKFAAWFVELQVRRSKSNRAVAAELYKKGVDREVASEALGGGEESEQERLKTLIAKKSQLSRYQKDPIKLKQYLMRQGFSYDLIKQMLDSP